MLGLRHALRLAADVASYSLVNRVWWILPLLLVLLVVALVVIVGQAAAPITLYPMF